MTGEATNSAAQTTPRLGSGTEPTWNVVLDYVVELLAKSGGAEVYVLPGERELASTLGVGRQSVREALRALQILGILHQGVGSGPTAGTRFINDSSIGFFRILNLYGRTAAFPVEDLVDLRITLERAGLSRLASQVQQGAKLDLSEPLGLVELMQESRSDAARFLHYDSLFHVALARAAGNSINGNLMAGLRGAIEAYFIDQIPTNWTAMSVKLMDEHNEIIRLINAGEPIKVSTCVEAHIVDYYKSRN